MGTDPPECKAEHLQVEIFPSTSQTRVQYFPLGTTEYFSLPHSASVFEYLNALALHQILYNYSKDVSFI